jgi:SAM-dependent methyltransferase
MGQRIFQLPVPTPYEELLGAVYDLYVTGWEHEPEFWRSEAAPEIGGEGAILELACGTGRVAVPLAIAGARIVGLDRWSTHLEIARSRSSNCPRADWVHADMRRFELAEQFSLAIMPGHGFQSLNSADDQLDCLRAIKRHLLPGGRAIFHLDHQSLSWLGSLPMEAGIEFQPGAEVVDPRSGHAFRQRISWAYGRATQTAWMVAEWEELGPDGAQLRTARSNITPLHCVFPGEMRHAINLAGLEVVDVYGGFDRSPLADTSESMIWVARNPE